MVTSVGKWHPAPPCFTNAPPALLLLTLHSDPLGLSGGEVTHAVNSTLWLSILALALMTCLHTVSDPGETQGPGSALGMSRASAGSLRSLVLL